MGAGTGATIVAVATGVGAFGGFMIGNARDSDIDDKNAKGETPPDNWPIVAAFDVNTNGQAGAITGAIAGFVVSGAVVWWMVRNYRL